MGSPESLAHLVYICFKASKQLNYINACYCTLLQMGELSGRKLLSAEGLHQTNATLLKKSTNPTCSFRVILLKGIFHCLSLGWLRWANASEVPWQHH